MGIFFGKIFRAILAALDDAVYKFVELLYGLFFKISETGIFQDGVIQSFASRIYFFLGLIMVFKVSISIINYIMNPDSLKDSKIGASKLLKNIVIILLGIILVPYIFEAAYSLQRIVLRDNVIGSLILGKQYTSETDASKYTKEAGRRMAFTTYTAFFHLSDDFFTEECYANPFKTDDKGNVINELNSACNSNESVIQPLQNEYFAAYESQNVRDLTKFKFINATNKTQEGEEEFIFSYMYLITTIAGGFLAYILLVFCFDIAVRSVKLGFLQLVAPIPLIAKVDPKKGDEVFNKWVKECTSTYVSLFIRLVAIYFAIYLITIITSGTFNILEPGKTQNDLFVNVFLIFGTLLFVKDLPKLIESITGMKLGTDGLNLRKKVASTPLIGGAAVATAGLAGRTAGHLARGGTNAIKNSRLGKSTGKLFSDTKNKLNESNAGKWVSATRKKIKNWSGNIDKFTGGEFGEIGRDASAAGHGMISAARQSVNGLDRRMDRLEMRKGQLMRKTQDANKRIAGKKAVTDAIKKMEDRAWDQISTGQAKVNDRDGVNLSDKYRELNAKLAVAKNANDAQAISDAQKNLDNFKQDAINQYMSSIQKDKDKTFDNLYAEYEKQFEISEPYISDEMKLCERGDAPSGALHTQLGILKGEISKINKDEIMVANDEISGIDSEIKQIQEDIKSGKPYMPFGPKK